MIINEALSYGVGIVSPQEIDEINILNASFLAMHRALDALSVRFNLILVDGNRFVPYHDISFKTIVGGDSKYQSIAAASILAKTTRDHLMTDYHKNILIIIGQIIKVILLWNIKMQWLNMVSLHSTDLLSICLSN